jgi:hypothetical protein
MRRGNPLIYSALTLSLCGLVFAIVGSLNTSVRVSTKPGQLQSSRTGKRRPSTRRRGMATAWRYPSRAVNYLSSRPAEGWSTTQDCKSLAAGAGFLAGPHRWPRSLCNLGEMAGQEFEPVPELTGSTAAELNARIARSGLQTEGVKVWRRLLSVPLGRSTFAWLSTLRTSSGVGHAAPSECRAAGASHSLSAPTGCSG